MTAFREMSDEIVVSGPTKTSIRTATSAGTGLQVDLRVVRPECYGAALQYFTGSQAHNVAVRQVAIRAGLKLSEYGLFRGDELIASATEDDVYAALGMDWVPPPMREDTGEVEAGIKRQIPALVQEKEIRGDLHTHTNLTDGVASLEEMIRQAEPKGYAYYAVTDHAPNLIMQRMTDEKMLAQRARLAALASSMVLLHGTELNIAPDGSVDWDEDFLSGFDMCVASVHSHFDQDRRAMTKRFIVACENPRVNIIGHPLTRKIGRRPPVDVDLGELFTGVRPHRHRARGQRLARPARPAGRLHQAGQGRGREVRDRHRRALVRRPGEHEVRGGNGAARLADLRRRDQHLAAGEAAGISSQGPCVIKVTGE